MAHMTVCVFLCFVLGHLNQALGWCWERRGEKREGGGWESGGGAVVSSVNRCRSPLPCCRRHTDMSWSLSCCRHVVMLWCRVVVMSCCHHGCRAALQHTQHITHHLHHHTVNQGNMQVESADLHTRYMLSFIRFFLTKKRACSIRFVQTQGVETPDIQVLRLILGCVETISKVLRPNLQVLRPVLGMLRPKSRCSDPFYWFVCYRND